MLSARQERRARAQRGSVLSALLIIVAFLAIIGGALMSELSSQFLITRSQAGRISVQASLDSSLEYGIGNLERRTVPSHCSTDQPAGSPLNLNGMWTAAGQSCQAIVPDLVTPIGGGSFSVDGIYDSSAGQNRYLISDSSGVLRAYQFGQSAPSWAVAIGGQQTADLLSTNASGSAQLLIPAAIPGSGCSNHCVALFNDTGGFPKFHCSMPASTSVISQPAAEAAVGGEVNFPAYAFFGDSGSAGNLYVFDANPSGSCDRKASAGLGGSVVGAPLVFPGTEKGNTVNDEIFVLVTGSGGTGLQHWRYSETTDNDGDGNNQTTFSLNRIATLSLNVGGNAVGYASDSAAPSNSAPMTLVVASQSGRLALVGITVDKSSYSMTLDLVKALPGGAGLTRPPYWCRGHCQGPDLIGVGAGNGTLYLLNTASLNIAYSYTQAGLQAINTTPIADANGDWYFGDDNGYVFDVELPAKGALLFKAASFGPGAQDQIRSSPVVGSLGGGCSGCIGMYFGAAGSGAGSYFAQLGTTRVMDITSCVTSGAKSTACVGAARLWARAEVGAPKYVGGQGVNVIGWSYYSNGLP